MYSSSILWNDSFCYCFKQCSLPSFPKGNRLGQLKFVQFLSKISHELLKNPRVGNMSISTTVYRNSRCKLSDNDLPACCTQYFKSIWKKSLTSKIIRLFAVPNNASHSFEECIDSYTLYRRYFSRRIYKTRKHLKININWQHSFILILYKIDKIRMNKGQRPKIHLNCDLAAICWKF